MGNRHLHKIECLHTLSMIESEQLKVTALNLFHPTAPPPFQKVMVFHIATQSHGGEGGVRGSGNSIKPVEGESYGV
jgi:hypothetical protein